METYTLLVAVPPFAEGITADGFRSENVQFQKQIHDQLNLLLAAPPFSRLNARVLQLEAQVRGVWGTRIFAAATPLLPASPKSGTQRVLPIDIPASSSAD